MGHVDYGQPQLLLETLDLVAHQDAEVRVEVDRGSSRRRTRGWTLSDRASATPLLAPGQLVGSSLAEPLEPDELEELPDSRRDLLRGRPRTRSA